MLLIAPRTSVSKPGPRTKSGAALTCVIQDFLRINYLSIPVLRSCMLACNLLIGNAIYLDEANGCIRAERAQDNFLYRGALIIEAPLLRMLSELAAHVCYRCSSDQCKGTSRVSALALKAACCARGAFPGCAAIFSAGQCSSGGDSLLACCYMHARSKGWIRPETALQACSRAVQKIHVSLE